MKRHFFFIVQVITSIVAIKAVDEVDGNHQNLFDVRTNFCDIHAKVEKGEVQLKDALVGLNISAAVGSEVNKENPYIAVRMLNEVARRGGFNVEYYATGYPGANESWTDVLKRNINNYDIACEWWERRIFRLDLGAVYPEGWYDADVIMIRKPPPTEDGFSFWAFSRPFSPTLWILIVIVILVTGMVYYLLDYLESRANKEDVDINFAGSLFYSFHAFTGHFNYQAKSGPVQVLSTSMCFLYLILISAYTANLANFFIIENAPGVIVNDLSDVFTHNLRLCVLHGYPLTVSIRKNYPQAQLVLKKDNDEVFIAVSEGECDVGLTSVEEWKTYSRDKLFNKDCDLEWIGRRVDIVEAGFTLKDSKDHCTSVFYNALNLLLIQMKTERIMEEVWEMHRESTTTPTCLAEKNEDETQGAGKTQLTVKNMGGAFAFHACLILVSISLGLYDFFNRPKEIKQEIGSEVFTKVSSVAKSFSSFTLVSAKAGRIKNLPHERSTRSLEASRKHLARRASLENFEHVNCVDTDDQNELVLHNQLFFSHRFDEVTELLKSFKDSHDRQSKEIQHLKDEIKTLTEERNEITISTGTP